MSDFEEVYNPDAPKASAEFDAWWKKYGDDALMNRTSGANFRYVYWMAHKAYCAGKEAARAEMDSEAKLPHAGLEVMGDIQINEGGDLQNYYRALVLTFNTNEDIRRAIAAEQCTFGFKE